MAHRSGILAVAACVAWLAGGASAPAGAAGLETLVMPGPVIQGHADVEDECTSCHRPFDRAAEDALCIACHEPVGLDLEAGEGFHGRAPAVAGTACRDCHTDHAGRDADIVGLNPALFDHGLTDHPLHGAHRAVPCAGCHAVDTAFRDAPLDCVGCHADDDPHRERLGTGCGDCHGDVRWSDARFDHDATAFPLDGRHAEAACGLCHADERWEGTPTDCASCHAVDDVHRGSFGSRCGECHGVADWKRSSFDHDRDTDFPLDGRHRGVDCASCHPRNPFEVEIASDCLSCHGADDAHRGRFGSDCQSCHETGAWATLHFDHDRETDFRLRGSHRDARCTACHTGTLGRESLGRDCVSCHRADDVHAGALGERCGTCHGEAEWSREVAFDHELTRFPLLGLHAGVACEECHLSPAYDEAETRCAACHGDDDVHEARLGTDCGLCHNPNAWPIWRFDHDAQTAFALHGAHEGVDCLSCHRAPLRPEHALPGECVDCHAGQDVHRGGFGRDCARCHGEDAWKEVRIGP